jgi:DNA adenine methylase
MRYLGGKYRLRSKIGRVINSYPQENYWEPFVGSAWVTTKVNKNKMFCSDINEYLIEMWNALLKGWIPPNSISEEEYYYIKEHKDENKPLTSFVGFGCSWGGKWFGGYARGESRNWAGEAKRSLQKKVRSLLSKNNIKFFVYDFSKSFYNISDFIIYCDPPYKGTTGYDAVENWNTEKFWRMVRTYVKLGNRVIVSEYFAPEDFTCIAKFHTKTDLNTNNGKDTRVEKLFTKEI